MWRRRVRAARAGGRTTLRVRMLRAGRPEPRQGQGRQGGLNLVAVRLEPWREDQALAQVLRIFVAVEARAVGGQLEQGAARLPEIYRLEPEPVDGRRGLQAHHPDGFAHLELFGCVAHPPGHVVDPASAPLAAPFTLQL